MNNFYIGLVQLFFHRFKQKRKQRVVLHLQNSCGVLKTKVIGLLEVMVLRPYNVP